MRKADEKEDRLVGCVLCGAALERAASKLRAHINAVHPDIIYPGSTQLAEVEKYILGLHDKEQVSENQRDSSITPYDPCAAEVQRHAVLSWGPKATEKRPALFEPNWQDTRQKKRCSESKVTSGGRTLEFEYGGTKASSFMQANPSQEATTRDSPHPRELSKSSFYSSSPQPTQTDVIKSDESSASQSSKVRVVVSRDGISTIKKRHPSMPSITDETRSSLVDDGPSERTRLILQPITTPVSHEQLIAEVKGIYAGLVMVEGKCLQVVANQSQLVKDAPPGQPPQLSNEQHQALIALHRTLLFEHHDFFLASQHPSATTGVKRLAAKYAMPARLWKHGIFSLLELQRSRLPDSIEHMISFIYLAYSIMSMLLETVPAFRVTWIECLGDLARYRMAIIEKGPEDEYDMESENINDESDTEQKLLIQQRIKDAEVRLSKLTTEEARKRRYHTRRHILSEEERSQWTMVAFEWYIKARNASPEVGRLYHHLAILSQTDETQQLFYYGKALTVSKPFEEARKSILTLFHPAFGQRKWRHGALKVDRAFITMHAVLFTKKDLHQFDVEFPLYVQRLEKYIKVKGGSFLKSQGLHMSIANANALIDYGKTANPIMCILPSSREDIMKDGSVTIPTSEDLNTFNMALQLFNGTAHVVLNSPTDNAILSFVYCTLIFMAHLATSPSAISMVEKDFPWQPLAMTLNSLIQSYSDYPRLISGSIPMPKDGDGEYKPFREDIALQQLFWAESFCPNSKFKGYDIEREDQFIENTKHYDKYRSERVLFMGVQLARRSGSLDYCEVKHQFSVPTQEDICTEVKQGGIVPMCPLVKTETETATLQDDLSMKSIS